MAADRGAVRTFIAIDLDAAVRRALSRLLSDWAALGADVRWSRPGGLHVTLKFLGAVEERRLPAVRQAVESAAAKHEALLLRVRGLGGFPSLRRPRVLWVGVAAEGLSELARDVDTALAALGFAAERRRLHPHVTLGRVRSARRWDRLEQAYKAGIEADFGLVSAGSVVIYRSDLRRDGALYTPLWTIALGRNK